LWKDQKNEGEGAGPLTLSECSRARSQTGLPRETTLDVDESGWLLQGIRPVPNAPGSGAERGVFSPKGKH
jgi:hypothetical protein